jgi:hypothetical protein
MSAIVFSGAYSIQRNGQNGVNNAPRAPEFNEVGAAADVLDNPGLDLTGFPDVLFVRMMAKQATPAGQPLGIAGDPADNPANDVVLREDPNVDPQHSTILILADEQVFLRPTTLMITSAGSPEFFNAHNPMDVNQDNIVSPADALTVSNNLNSMGSVQLFGTPLHGQMIDTNMDGMLSPSDALAVVNYLNAYLVSSLPAHTAPAAGGEGEGEGEMSAMISAADSSASNSNSVSNSLSSGTSSSTMLVTSPSSSSGGSGSSATSTAGSASDDCSTATSSVDTGAADELYASLADIGDDLASLSRKR